MKGLFIVASCFFFLFCNAYQVHAMWHIEEVDTPRYFSAINNRSMAISPDGTVHVTYGGDHLYHATYDGNASSYETVYSSPRTGNITSLAVGSSGKVHILYSGSDGFLKYASNVSGAWVIETVDNIISADFSFALDSNGKAHISYYDWTYDFLKYATNESGIWVTEIVDNQGAYATSLALDSEGKVHISYSNGNLKYSTNISGFWTTEVVVGSEDYVSATSLAVDSNDNVHISYSDPTLKYATNLSGLWAIESVDYNSVDSPSLVLDANNKPRISYFDLKVLAFKYATNFSGSWSTVKVQSTPWQRFRGSWVSSIALASSEKVRIIYRDYEYDLTYSWCDVECGNTSNWHIEGIDRSSIVGRFNSLALDSSDKAHIGYGGRISNDSELKYATNAFGSWVIEAVAQSGVTGEYNSLALDPNDKAHISCLGGYFTNSTGLWVRATVSIGYFTSLSLDANQGVHISYYDDSGRDLKYVTNATGSWVTETVDSLENTGATSSLAIDSSGKVHICYWAEPEEFYRGIKYATNRSGSWETEMIVVGRLPSLAVDKDDKAHISFWNSVVKEGSSYNTLQYATNASGSWVIETVDSIVGRYTSLALDSSDKIHISYFGQSDDGSNGRPSLKYATNASGSWEKETIDSSGCIGDFSSIALDSHGEVHISYDDCNYDLKYARQCPETDIDCDEIVNDDDNCPTVYNPLQEDNYPPGGNGCGNICDCEGNFDCDEDCDGSDAVLFKMDFGRSTSNNPCTSEPQCNGDFDCDNDCDGTDAGLFKSDFGRSSYNNPCPACTQGEWCDYPLP